MENLLEHLNQVNDVPVYSVLDPEFAPYGRVVTGYDLSEMIAYMEQNTATGATLHGTALSTTRAARSMWQSRTSC